MPGGHSSRKIAYCNRAPEKHLRDSYSAGDFAGRTVIYFDAREYQSKQKAKKN